MKKPNYSHILLSFLIMNVIIFFNNGYTTEIEKQPPQETHTKKIEKTTKKSINNSKKKNKDKEKKHYTIKPENGKENNYQIAKNNAENFSDTSSSGKGTSKSNVNKVSNNIPEVIKGITPDANKAEDKEKLPDDFDYSIENFILKTLVILFFLCGGGFLLFKWLKTKKKYIANTKVINKLGMLSIAPNKFLQIVEIANRVYIVGVGDNINLIGEITDKEDIDLIKLLASEESEVVSFKDQLTGFLDRIQKSRKKSESELQEDLELKQIEQFKEKQDKLKNLK